LGSRNLSTASDPVLKLWREQHLAGDVAYLGVIRGIPGVDIVARLA